MYVKTAMGAIRIPCRFAEGDKGSYMKQKMLSVWLVLLIVLSLSFCDGKMHRNDRPYKSFNKMASYQDAVPYNYKYTDYKALAERFDALVFDFNAHGEFLPLIWNDITNNSYGIPAYVGDGRMHADGTQEAVTAVAAVLYASLNGIDKSSQNGIDYVDGLNAFFSKEEGIILNNPSGASKTTSMWYLLYPAILFTQVSVLYDDHDAVRANAITNIENWYRAYVEMRKTGNFDYTGFDFITMEPYSNGIWKEPDCAVGMAVLFKYGYDLTGDEKYMAAIMTLMDYIENFFGGPLYEILMYYAPVMAAYLNTVYGTEYNLQTSLNSVFDGFSVPRGGWGSLAGTWGGDIDVHGLFGSTTDGGGYAFSMNTFAAAGAIAPVVRYDARYAKSIGKFMLHLHNNARYFYSGEIKSENQSVSYVDETVPESIITSVPYEGIRKQSSGYSPWVGGDPTVYGWAKTDFALYSGAHVGILGRLFEETNQEAILKVDLLATDSLLEKAYPTFLIYNPHGNSLDVSYHARSPMTDLYNAVTNKVIARNVVGETLLAVKADEALVIVEIPAGEQIQRNGRNYYAGGVYISSDRIAISIEGAENNGNITGDVILTVKLASNFDDKIKRTVLTSGDVELAFVDRITVSAQKLGSGSKLMQFTAETYSGLTDTAMLRLVLQ